MKNNEIRGAFPTMVTPYNRDNTVDYGAVRALVRWYYEQGCAGIFASCQSSEIAYLGLADRVGLARTVKDEADIIAAEGGRRMTVVASGHVSDDFDEQVYELSSVADTGADAVILISNRIDIQNISDDMWISGCERLISRLPDSAALGVYECPMPYKRLMTEKTLGWCAGTGRFRFMKDTCCDADMIEKRCRVLGGSPMMLYNANAQTLLSSLRSGAAGYCGVMCNFHPKLYAWLCENFDKEPDRAEKVQSFLCLSAFTESLAYPCTAKWHLRRYEGIDISTFARSRDDRMLRRYDRDCVSYMNAAATALMKELDIL